MHSEKEGRYNLYAVRSKSARKVVIVAHAAHAIKVGILELSRARTVLYVAVRTAGTNADAGAARHFNKVGILRSTTNRTGFVESHALLSITLLGTFITPTHFERGQTEPARD